MVSAAATTARAAVEISEIGEPVRLSECPRGLCRDGAPSLCSTIEPSPGPAAGDPISARPAAAQAVDADAAEEAVACAVACGECAPSMPHPLSARARGARERTPR